tara:strand:- start:2796 stop:3503 length:708 start_codon:yes stop_codon:yes gene_type:complete
MLNQDFKNLLVNQERDQDVRRIWEQLESVPKGIQAHKTEIKAEEDALAESKSKLQGLEVQRNDLEMQVGSAQDQIAKYKTQQLQVKKNEEFQALTHEIEALEKKISDWEEEEIGLLLDIDSETEVFSKRESVFGDLVSKIRGQINALEQRQAELQGELAEAQNALGLSKEAVKPNLLNSYERLSTRTKMPVVVAVEDQKCLGCHLRISNVALEQARKGEELTTCDNCGRIVYLAS